MKRKVFGTTAAVGLFVAATAISNAPVQGHDDGLFFRRESEIQRGFAISPVWLNLEGKDPALVGLGSYIVNAQAGCNDCHTCPAIYTFLRAIPSATTPTTHCANAGE